MTKLGYQNSLNKLSQNLGWVITSAIWPRKPQVKAIAPFGASRKMGDIFGRSNSSTGWSMVCQMQYLGRVTSTRKAFHCVLHETIYLAEVTKPSPWNDPTCADLKLPLANIQGGPKKWYLSYIYYIVREVSLFWPTRYVAEIGWGFPRRSITFEIKFRLDNYWSVTSYRLVAKITSTETVGGNVFG